MEYSESNGETLPHPLVFEEFMREHFFSLTPQELENRWWLIQNGPEFWEVLEAYKKGDEGNMFTATATPEAGTPVEAIAFGLDKDQTDWDLYDECQSFGETMRKVTNDTLTKVEVKLNAWLRTGAGRSNG